ncbi:hypothetical protein Q604_UNBC17680G0001, partial [human gut metagenome]
MYEYVEAMDILQPHFLNRSNSWSATGPRQRRPRARP